MPVQIKILGVHPVAAGEPVHLLELELNVSAEDFDFGSVTQEIPGEPQSDWQVAYDEQPVTDDEAGLRWTFFFHCLDCNRPLLTQFGPVALPKPTPIPEHLKGREYGEP